jgi:hypothetical protein
VSGVLIDRRETRFDRPSPGWVPSGLPIWWERRVALNLAIWLLQVQVPSSNVVPIYRLLSRHEAARINTELKCSRLVTLANQDTAMCVWSEQTRGAKLARNVPVRESHTPKTRGYPRGQPRARKTNSCKRRKVWHSAKGDWECIGTSSGAG